MPPRRRRASIIGCVALVCAVATGSSRKDKMGVLAPVAGDIMFHATAFPTTWVGSTVGLVNPRLNSAYEVPAEFPAAPTEVTDDYTDSILHANSPSTSEGAANDTLATFDGYTLDLYIVNGASTLWPCVAREGGHDLRIDAYNASGAGYTVSARYSINKAGEPYFACSLTSVPPSVFRRVPFRSND